MTCSNPDTFSDHHLPPRNRGPEKSSLSQPIAKLPTQAYDHLLGLWHLHINGSEPDQQKLRDLHEALSTMELLLHQLMLTPCLQNLTERLQQAQQLGLELPMPLWATRQIERLQAWAQEYVDSEERP